VFRGKASKCKYSLLMIRGTLAFKYVFFAIEDKIVQMTTLGFLMFNQITNIMAVNP